MVFMVAERHLIMLLTFLFCSNGFHRTEDIIYSSQPQSRLHSKFPTHQNEGNSILSKIAIPKKKPVSSPSLAASSYPNVHFSKLLEFNKEKFAKYSQSVVQVVSNIFQYNWEKPWESSSDMLSTGTAFWTLINGKGYFVTNAHVIHNSISTIIKIPKYGSRQFNVDVVGMCLKKDLALLSLSKPDTFPIKMVPLVWGNSDDYEQGSIAIGIGYPLGQAGRKITSGIVSGFEHVDGRYYAQITTPINPGNSGGPLLNEEGQVMGINSAAIPSATNVGYALPSQNILHILESCVPTLEMKKIKKKLTKTKAAKKKNLTKTKAAIEKESVELNLPIRKQLLPSNILHKFPSYGVTISSTTKELIEYMKSPATGVYISKVTNGTFFSKAGIKQGDILLRFDGWDLDDFGQSVISPDQRMNIFDLGERIKNGKNISMVVWREGKNITKFAEFIYDEEEVKEVKYIEEPVREQVNYEVFGGMVVMELTLNHIENFIQSNPNIGSYLYDDKKLYSKRLVLSALLYPMTNVPEGSIIQGAIFHQVNGHTVNSLDDFRKALIPKKGEIYCNFTTESGSLVVLNLIDTLVQELRISQLNGYKITSAVRNMFRTKWIRKAMMNRKIMYKRNI